MADEEYTDEMSAAQALSDAWDDAESTLEEPVHEEHEPDNEAAEPELRSESATGEVSGGDTESGATSGDPDIEGGVRSGEEQGAGAAEGEGDEKPPVGLSAAAREAWKETPPAIREEIAKRERDFAVGIQRYAEGAKRAQAMDSAMQPYRAYIDMNGGPGQAVTKLLQTGTFLQMGSQQQKAEAIAGVIKQFGVDITTLDNILAGEAPPPEVAQQSQVEQMLQQRLAPYEQQMQQIQQQREMAERQAQERINSEVTEFSSKNEFYNDVKLEMADIMDMAANRGQEMSLQEAYDKACQLHPEVSKVIASRQQRQSVGNKRRASSSVSGSPGGVGERSTPDSTRAAIEQAWENAGRI